MSGSPTTQYRRAEYSPTKTSPLRNNSNASTTSTIYSQCSSTGFAPSRTSTVSSATSSAYLYGDANHKRGLSDTAPISKVAHGDSAPRSAGSERLNGFSRDITLRPLSQVPNLKSSTHHPMLEDTRDGRRRSLHSIQSQYDGYSSHAPDDHKPLRSRINNAVLHRSDSLTTSRSLPHTASHSQASSSKPSATSLTGSELSTLKKSTTSHLRTLSRLAQEQDSNDLTVHSNGPDVVGLHGRRQLKRTDSTRAKTGSTVAKTSQLGSAWTESNWMEKQRQFLQAYEYLCHIGEAKEWIEDIIERSIPPIVQLEEALRDGVILAEIVQKVFPDRPLRIFRHSKLQFRHSDNIAAFFRFLADVELPDLFRFELIDLYEKKNIPKVIYCIHALSWLLFRNGLVGFKIGNLIGQLEFEHHELEEVQRGLDKSGINMPSFAGMSANFGAEPAASPSPAKKIESEQERRFRALTQHEHQIVDLQSQIRASVIRIDLGNEMQGLWDCEDAITDLQALVRAKWSREVFEYRLYTYNSVVKLQSRIKGLLARRMQESVTKNSEHNVSAIISLQSLSRAIAAKNFVSQAAVQLRRRNHEVAGFQAAVRGALRRREIHDQHEESHHVSLTINKVQAISRGLIFRQAMKRQMQLLAESSPQTSRLQAVCKGRSGQSKFDNISSILRELPTAPLQAQIRGFQHRQRIQDTLDALALSQSMTKNFQAAARAAAERLRICNLLHTLEARECTPVAVQARIRGLLFRSKRQADWEQLQNHGKAIVLLQAQASGMIFRRAHRRMQAGLDSQTPRIVKLQGLARAMLQRLLISDLLADLEDQEDNVTELQAAIHGSLVRRKFAEKQRYYKTNMDRVIKVQSFVRAKIQGEAYKSLTTGQNPPVGTVKSFVHLLNDSDFDFEEEVEFERLRKTVVQHVRQNEMADQYIAQLDIKIALLVKNKITLDEVVKHQKHFGGAAGHLLTTQDSSGVKDPFDLKALNKNSRRKLEHYQELFFILQTQPQYLARLFRRLREQATAEKECERLKHLMMGVFGYAQKRREEYYLIKLVTRSMREEIDNCTTIQEYTRGSPFWSKLFGSYIKSPRDRKYLRDLLGATIKEAIIENAELDLESDPMQIYLSALEDEELRTGRQSSRNPDIPREAAIRDPETKRTFITHLQDLRDIADQIFLSLDEQLPKMPFGVRYVAQQMYHSLAKRFPYENRGDVLSIVGFWVWKNYLQPALTEAEKYGIVDRGLSSDHRRNIGQVAKLLGQVASGRLFGGENVFLQPLNIYVGESIERLTETWSNLIDVPAAEEQFDIDEFNDLYSRTKPTLYIKMADIIAVHHLVVSEVSSICPHRDDLLQEVISELGSAKHNESELRGVSGSEICLTLNPKLHESQDPEADIKALMTETKRCILYIIRIQSGSDLMEIMVKPITMDDEDRWASLIYHELSADSRNRGAYAEANITTDVAAMSYAELKRTALENILQLERKGRLSRHNHYQDLLNAIALDIRTKHRRRIQRQRELDSVRLTLARLNDQASFLEGQLKTYNDYIEQAMMTLHNKKGKKRFVLPFTKQWDHERELARSGRVPRFGSFKYSAQDLANRGILLSWEGYSDPQHRQYQPVDLTVASNEVGIFTLDGSNGSIAIPGASALVPLDDLLQAQYNNQQVLEFFDGGEVRVNVNLFLHLIMRKFYKNKE